MTEHTKITNNIYTQKSITHIVKHYPNMALQNLRDTIRSKMRAEHVTCTLKQTSSSAVTKRPRDASCLSVL